LSSVTYLVSSGHLSGDVLLPHPRRETTMPTIAFVSPKGGAGKTTSAFLLATTLAKFQPVTVIDADPNHPIQTWANGGNAPPGLTVVSDVDEDTIIERIEDSAAKTPFVVVDLEGTASKIVLLAISQADLVIIPTQGSQLDANEAGRAIRVVLQSHKMTKTAKPYAVLLTRTSPSIRTRTQAHIQNGLIGAGIPVFETELNERDAFRAVFSFQQTLDGLNPAEVANLDKAKHNVWTFVEEVVARLKAEQGSREEDETTDVAGAA
jgi:chromosome partitioning protein